MNQRKKENKKKFRKTVKGCDERNKRVKGRQRRSVKMVRKIEEVT